MSDTHIVIYSTFPDAEQASKVGKALVEKELAACVNIMQPHEAIYKWEGKVQSEQEVVMIAKTKAELFDRAKAEICKLHSYDVPCVVSLDIADASAEFLNWIDNQTIKA